MPYHSLKGRAPARASSQHDKQETARELESLFLDSNSFLLISPRAYLRRKNSSAEYGCDSFPTDQPANATTTAIVMSAQNTIIMIIMPNLAPLNH
jgi:hypothetical protein